MLHSAEVPRQRTMGKYGAVRHHSETQECILKLLPCITLGRGSSIGNGIRDAKAHYDPLPNVWVLVSEI
jgi:hypothetical protein